MSVKKSIFDFEKEFEIKTPLDNWASSIEEQWSREQVLQKIKYHLNSNPPPEECVEHGLYVKTIGEKYKDDKKKTLIPGLPLPNAIGGFKPEDPAPKEEYYYFPTDYKLKYVELIHHLTGRKGEVQKLKKKDFWVVVEGESFAYDGTPRGVQRAKVHEKLIVMNDQMKFYFEMDVLSARLNDIERGGTQIPKDKQAFAYYNAIVKNKNLDLMFKPSDLNKNTDRLFVNFTDEIQEPEITLTEFEITGGSRFELELVESTSMIGRIKDNIREKNPGKTFSDKEPTILINRMKVYFPLIEIRRKGIPGNAVGSAHEGSQAPYPHFSYLNLQELNIAHEIIHAHQNTTDDRFQKDRALGRLVESDVVRGWKRELLAYHFSIFPNKKYASPSLDPVFKTTKFVRGESAIFGNVHEVSIAFWVWACTRYIFQLEDEPGALGDDELSASLRECMKEIVDLRKCFQKKGYKFFDGGSYNWDEEWFKDANEKFYKKIPYEIDTKSHQKAVEEQEEDHKPMKKTQVSPVTDETEPVDFDDQGYIDNRKIIDDTLVDMHDDLIDLLGDLLDDNSALA